MRLIQSPAELYAHAIAIEREAAARYLEFAERMADEGRDELASVFSSLAGAEAEHLQTLLRRSEGMALPAIADNEYHWLDTGAPETAAREFVFRLMTPRQALAIALRAEQRAEAFFERFCSSRSEPALRALAKEMLAEGKQHASMVQRLIASTPQPLDSTLLFRQSRRARPAAPRGSEKPV